MMNPIQSHLTMDLFEGHTLKQTIEKVEERVLKNTLESLGTTRKAAKALGVSQPTIVRKAAKYNIKFKE